LGPNKVLFLGWIQPILDGVKLIFKEVIILSKNNLILNNFRSFLRTVIILLIWSTIPAIFFEAQNILSFLIFMILIGVSVYTIIFIG